MIEQLELLLKIILELILLLLNPMILFPVLIIIGINYYKNKKYKEETTYGVEEYDEGEQVSRLTAKNNGVVTLYARWKKV